MAKRGYAGKVAIITGGASGIGAALAKELAQAGAQVVLADRQVGLAEQVAAEIRASGGQCAVSEVDVRDLASVTRIVKETIARVGVIDYFFNNAGIGVAGEMDRYEPRDWDDVFDVNLRGVAHGIQAVYRVMIGQRSGHIVNTASVAGLFATPGEGSYGATKHAVVGLSKVLRLEAKRHGVHVSVLCPGPIRTPILTGGKYGRMDHIGLSNEKVLEMWEKLRPINADTFARKALRAVLRNDAIIVIPAWWRAVWFVDRLSPALSEALWSSLGKRMNEERNRVEAKAPHEERSDRPANESSAMHDARSA
jgi:NAD(P)-dependent dehydrogenase (short-subunit alcohol dehydrogenase family)